MSNERDELADDIPRVTIGTGYYAATIGYDEAREIADELIQLGYRKPRTVTTAEELDSLPEGSVVLDNIGDAWTKTDVDFWQCFQTFNDGSGLALCGPLTVIHEAVAR